MWLYSVKTKVKYLNNHLPVKIKYSKQESTILQSDTSSLINILGDSPQCIVISSYIVNKQFDKAIKSAYQYYWYEKFNNTNFIDKSFIDTVKDLCEEFKNE